MLGISTNSDSKAIKTAYYALAKKHHPDTAGANEPSASTTFGTISSAYEILSNPKTKGDYDTQLYHERQARQASGDGFYGMNAEEREWLRTAQPMKRQGPWWVNAHESDPQAEWVFIDDLDLHTVTGSRGGGEAKEKEQAYWGPNDYEAVFDDLFNASMFTPSTSKPTRGRKTKIHKPLSKEPKFSQWEWVDTGAWGNGRRGKKGREKRSKAGKHRGDNRGGPASSRNKAEARMYEAENTRWRGQQSQRSKARDSQKTIKLKRKSRKR